MVASRLVDGLDSSKNMHFQKNWGKMATTYIRDFAYNILGRLFFLPKKIDMVIPSSVFAENCKS